MMCQCKFISCNKCTTFVGDVNNRGAYACVRQELNEKSLSLPLVCYKPYTALKNKISILLEVKKINLLRILSNGNKPMKEFSSSNIVSSLCVYSNLDSNVQNSINPQRQVRSLEEAPIN